MLITNVDSDGSPSAPRHPVRDGPHVDGAEHRLAEPAAIEQVLHGPHRLVVAHVLVDRERRSRLGAQRSTRSRASRTDIASGFWARMPRSRPLPSSTARRMRAGWTSGGTATSRISTRGSASRLVDGVVDGRDAVPRGDFAGGRRDCARRWRRG